jgi:hypothetical protein
MLGLYILSWRWCPETKPFNIMRIYKFAILEKTEPDTDNIGDLNLAVVRHTVVFSAF